MHISGVDVKLPPNVKPYPSQKLMMFRILQSLKTCQHAMIESPTGSGKTLGLLSSTCAWLEEYKAERAKSKLACPKHGAGSSAAKDEEEDEEAEDFGGFRDANDFLDPSELETAEIVDLSNYAYAPQADDDDFVEFPTSAKRKSLGTPAPRAKRPKTEKEKPPKEDKECNCLPKVRIYYGTRTHKQIGQVVKEFTRLPYAGIIKHTILASRDQSCINDEVKKSQDVTAACKELNGPEGTGCMYKTNIRAGRLETGPQMRRFVERHGETVWDLEDLVEALGTSKPPVCPYFASTRVLTEDADLIFCPFSYLLDPIIRNSSDVFMNKAVVILDEAHNVEDTCRDAASFNFTEAEVISTVEELTMKRALVHKAQDKLLDLGYQSKINNPVELPDSLPDTLNEVSDHVNVLLHFTQSIHKWMVQISCDVVNAPAKYGGKQTKTMQFTSLINSFKNHPSIYFKSKENDGATVSEEDAKLVKLFQDIMKSYNFMCSVDKPNPNGPPLDDLMQKALSTYRLSGNTIVCMEKFLYFMGFYTKKTNNIDNSTTYKPACLLLKSLHLHEKEYESVRFGKSGKSGFGQGGKYAPSQALSTQWYEPEDEDTENTWMEARPQTPSRGLKPIKANHKVTVNLWCMVAALSFRDAFANCRSVILASGTLTPVDTFESELGSRSSIRWKATR
ncbi:hypothetical protein L596_017489 [Steinernema carpocapsae]|uniref:Helicase ATP-binding domain-containing protein n=1 Tax=Steinernema carpocapsae TaxID=34508 RepID=A0A4U5N1U7_STECR|nr:hypothetical protein L596_017489 [Steinernema carpocapsae]